MTHRKMSLWQAYGSYYVHLSDCPNSSEIVKWHVICYTHGMRGIHICPHECCGPNEYIAAVELIYNEAFNKGHIRESQRYSAV